MPWLSTFIGVFANRSVTLPVAGSTLTVGWPRKVRVPIIAYGSNA
ncbi:hypothetical protein BURPSS13_C0158 [Burkholderia pseudomallei S13]|nr:hypothetical protein BURPSS13_C0158 [Burkholderia pseudomallei S13]